MKWHGGAEMAVKWHGGAEMAVKWHGGAEMAMKWRDEGDGSKGKYYMVGLRYRGLTLMALMPMTLMQLVGNIVVSLACLSLCYNC